MKKSLTKLDDLQGCLSGKYFCELEDTRSLLDGNRKFSNSVIGNKYGKKKMYNDMGHLVKVISRQSAERAPWIRLAAYRIGEKRGKSRGELLNREVRTFWF